MLEVTTENVNIFMVDIFPSFCQVQDIVFILLTPFYKRVMIIKSVIPSVFTQYHVIPLTGAVDPVCSVTSYGPVHPRYPIRPGDGLWVHGDAGTSCL